MTFEFSQHEKLVLDIVQDYLSHNKYFNMVKIIPFIRSNLKTVSVDLNARAVEEILGSLVRKKFIVEGTNLTQLDVLKNSKRNQIYNYILKNPGAYINKIVRLLNISKPVVVWHINMLLRFDFIRKEEIENHEIFFDSKLSSGASKFTYVTSKDRSKKIIDYLKENNFGVAKTRISLDLVIHHDTITKYLEMLEDLDIVYKKKINKQMLYFLNEDLAENLHLKTQ